MSETVHVLEGREVPLGGLRAMTVRRTLPHRDRAFVGAWCFADHYGPTRIGPGGHGGMDLPPHPHTGLQTVSWLFDGELEHRDSGGGYGMVRPGEVNLMTAGHGIAHSEVSTPQTRVLHGAQLWVALPDSDRETARAFEHHVPPVSELPGGAGTVRVFLGKMPDLGSSPVQIFTPLVGAQLDLAPDADLTLPVDPAWEHAVLLDTGSIEVGDAPISGGDLACIDTGQESLHVRAGSDGARILLLGGEPFEEEIVMWWNFVGRSHDDIADYRQRWEEGSERFGHVPGYVGEATRIPAPPLPNARLKPRRRR